jgi:hypothetical protein
MRAYMRRKRAGQSTTTPRPPKPKSDGPSQRVINQIAYWACNPWRARGIGPQVIDGLVLDNDESWQEACRRHKVLTEERRAKREREKLEAAKPTTRYCSFCHEPTTIERMFWGDETGYPLICDVCVAAAATAIAEHKVDFDRIVAEGAQRGQDAAT